MNHPWKFGVSTIESGGDMHKNVFFTKFPKNENGYQGNQFSQQWAK